MTRRRTTAAEHRIDFADYARDAKREGGICAHGLCTRSHGLEYHEKRGRNGGHHWCDEHYPDGDGGEA